MLVLLSRLHTFRLGEAENVLVFLGSVIMELRDNHVDGGKLNSTLVTLHGHMVCYLDFERLKCQSSIQKLHSMTA